MSSKILVLPGDGIGVEVEWEAGVRAFAAELRHEANRGDSGIHWPF